MTLMTRSYATTNVQLDQALSMVEELIAWAEADRDHARENGARDTARDDQQRVRDLTRAYDLLKGCFR